MFMAFLLSCQMSNPANCVVNIGHVFPTRAECEALDHQEPLYQFAVNTNPPDFIPVEFTCYEWKWTFPNA